MGGRRWMLMKHGARAPRRSVGGGRRGGPLRAFAVPCASASWSEHLLSSTLTLAAVAAWLVFARTRDAWTRLAALLLVPAVAMTRPEAIVHVALVPLWTLWRDSVEEPASRGRRWRDALASGGALGVSAALVWVGVLRPHDHPPLLAADL